GQTSLVSSRVDVESPSSRDTVKFSPRDAGPSTKDLDAHSDAHRHALAQRDRMRANAEGQTAVSSCHDVKLRHVHSAEEHAPQLFPCDAIAQPKPVSSSSAGTSVTSSPAPTGSDVARGSDSPKESGLMSSVTLTFSPTRDSPDLSCALSREMKARNLRGVDVPAVQEAHIRLCSESRGQVLSPSRKDAQAAAPCAPLAARAINPLGARAEDCEQRQILDFKTSGSGRAVDEESEEGITCRSSADVCNLTNVALPRQSGEKAARPNAPIHAHAMVVTRARISSHSSREGEKGSPQSAEARRDRDESPEQLPDLDGQRRVVRARAESLSPSSSSALRRQTTCEPPDKTSSNDSSLHSCEPPLRLRSSTVSSSAPLLRSSHHSTSGRGPDSANWRARWRPTASPPWEVNTLDADSQSKSISERERGLEVSDLREDVDVESLKARGDKKGLPQSAERRCDESPARFPDLDGQCHALQPSADIPSPSPSTASRHQAARKPPDKTTLKSSSLHRSGSGSDSVNWRTRGRLATLSPREVSTLSVGLRSKSIDERERERASEKGSPQDAESDRNVANLHHPHWEASSQAFAQDRPQVYAGGQVLASSPRDGKPESWHDAGKCLPRDAKSSTALTVLDHSLCAQAMVKPRTRTSSCSSLNTPECSPPSTECDGNEEPLQSADSGHFPDSIGQCRPPRASAGGLSPSPLIVSRYHVAREPSDETTSNGPSLGGSRSTSLSHFAMVPSAAPLPLSPSSAAPRILGARQPPDKTSDRSSANSCQPARRSHPASVLSSIPLPRSSRRPKGASEPDSAHWRVREWPAALNVPRCKIGVNSWGAQNREWLSPRLDVADTAAPSTSRRHLHAFEHEHVLKPLENGASDLKRTHAGGRTVFLSWKRVKPLAARGEKKESPQLTASDTECQRSPSLELDQAMPPTGGRGDLVLGCDGRDIGILHAEKLPCVTLSRSVDVPDALALGRAACPDVMLRLMREVSPIDKDRRCVAGYVQRLYDDPGGPADVASPGDGHPSDAYSISSPSRLLVCRSLRQPVVHAENSRTHTTVDRHASFEVPVAFALVGPRSAEWDMSARLAVHSQIGGDTFREPMDRIRMYARKDGTAAQDSPRCGESATYKCASSTTGSHLELQSVYVPSSRRALALRVGCRLPDIREMSLGRKQSAIQRMHLVSSPRATHLRLPRWEMRVMTHPKTGAGGPTECGAQNGGEIGQREGLGSEASCRRQIKGAPSKPSGIHTLSRISNSLRTTRDYSPPKVIIISYTVSMTYRCCLVVSQDFPTTLRREPPRYPHRTRDTTDAQQSCLTRKASHISHIYPSRCSGSDAGSVARRGTSTLVKHRISRCKLPTARLARALLSIGRSSRAIRNSSPQDVSAHASVGGRLTRATEAPALSPILTTVAEQSWWLVSYRAIATAPVDSLVPRLASTWEDARVL
ncbi:hypothetical protein K523DRAFT_408045, partial [Schizophyllum commune Tattone D]